MWQIELVPSSGDPDLILGYNTSGHSTVTLSENLVGSDRILLCPSDSPPVTPFLIDIPSNGVSSYLLTISMWEPITQYKPQITPYSRPSFGSFSEFDFETDDGVPFLLHSPNAARFRFQVTREFYGFFSCHLHIETRGLSRLTILFGDFTWSFTTELYSGRSYYDGSICHGGVFTYYELKVEVEVMGNSPVKFFFTTADSSILVPFYTLPPLEAFRKLSQINYQAFKFHYCTGDVAAAWASNTPNPYNPPQKMFFPDIVSFDDFEWSYPPNAHSPTSLFSFLLLYGDSSPEVALDSVCLFFGGSIVDENGEALVRDEVCQFSPKVTSCDASKAIRIGDVLIHTIKTILNPDFSESEEEERTDPLKTLVRLDLLRAQDNWMACERQIDSFFVPSVAANDSIVDMDYIDSLCVDVNCTLLFLNDYQVSKANAIDGGCPAMPAGFDPSWYWECQEVFFLSLFLFLFFVTFFCCCCSFFMENQSCDFRKLTLSVQTTLGDFVEQTKIVTSLLFAHPTELVKNWDALVREIRIVMSLHNVTILVICVWMIKKL